VLLSVVMRVLGEFQALALSYLVVAATLIVASALGRRWLQAVAEGSSTRGPHEAP
jgi:hypothetical protein